MKLRRLTDGEVSLATEVFGTALDARRLWLVEGAPTLGWAMVIGRFMLFPVSIADFAVEDVPRRSWFVHELTHAWQFQNRLVWTLLSWAGVAFSGGYLTGAAYRLTLPFDWDRLNLEQQARVVEQVYLRRFSAPRGEVSGSWQTVIDAWRGGGSALEALNGRPAHDPRHR